MKSIALNTQHREMGCVPSNFRESFQRSFRPSRTSTYDPINPVFGVPLINLLCSEKSPYVAKIVVDCVEFIEQDENIANEDIYSVLRPLSDPKKIDKLKQKIHVDGKYDVIRSQDVCVVADVLRQFFKELRPSIIPMKSFETTFGMETDFGTDESLIKLIKYLRRLDAETFDTLKYLIGHLHTMSKCGSNNAKDLATVWAPCIFDSASIACLLKYIHVVQILINHYEEIFAD